MFFCIKQKNKQTETNKQKSHFFFQFEHNDYQRNFKTFLQNNNTPQIKLQV